MKTTVKQLATGTLIVLLLSMVNVVSANADRNDLNSDSIEMISPSEEILTVSYNYSNSYEFRQETETGLDIENWMTDTENWNFEFNLTNETEAGLELESWMTSAQIWNVNEIYNEIALTIESWMTDSKIWK
jgi:hypothetical protein